MFNIAIRKLAIKTLALLVDIIPKDKNSIYMKQSMPFKDNISAIIEELRESNHNSKYMIYLHGDNLKEYESDNIQCVKPGTIKSVWHFLRSYYVLFDNGLYGSIYSKNQITVHLTHGMLCKKYGYPAGAFEDREKLGILSHQTCTYVTVSSELFVDPWSEALGVPVENVLVTGLPRNDYFGKKYNNNIHDLFGDLEYRKAIVWMPTYRRSSSAKDPINGADYELGLPLIDNQNLEMFDSFLSKLGIALVVKYHTLQDSFNNMDYKPKNIKFITTETVLKMNLPINGFLSQFDALITDYSSVFYDYILLDRPICNIIDDIAEYENTRGFAFDNITEILTYCTVSSIEELMKFILDVSNNNDQNYDKRNKMKLIFNKFNDSGNAKRVLSEVGII